eukprot:Blabericola_migrator_1__8612@NODE_450_length_8372_cov_59_228898_g352_i0_p4_GENE_NODE_450_length_8372_cov_59_228898_g352_i0NODE_450_length_8372_cov_59_228898_g352_i0_p4_ORF_typecomplete_len314_score51_96YTH/PF04146_15/2_2e36ADH_zinc_N/PF00107_26/0_16_NODE_450_length_8372_cov_59_228898_g352_i045865527
MHKLDHGENLWLRLKVNPNTQYFLLKSFAAEHVVLSKETGVWATGLKKERVLAAAFSTGNPVVLVFSVNGSGKFFGYALMVSRPGECSVRRSVFTGPDGQPFPGNQFHVQWINTREMSFKYFEHITNELNENKPVKVGRDGQQISWSAGGKLLEVFENVVEPQQTSSRTPAPRAVVFVDNRPPTTAPMSETPVAQSPIDSTAKPPPPPPPSGSDKKLMSSEDPHVTVQECVAWNPLLSIYPIDLTKMTYEGYLALRSKASDENLSRYISTVTLGSAPQDWSELAVKATGASDMKHLAKTLADLALSDDSIKQE